MTYLEKVVDSLVSGVKASLAGEQVSETEAELVAAVLIQCLIYGDRFNIQERYLTIALNSLRREKQRLTQLGKSE